MFYQAMPRRGYTDLRKKADQGFFVEGKDFTDCINQLEEWASNHPEKWVYYHNYGVAPGYPVPVARNVFEVEFFDWEPAALMWSWVLFQEGSEGKREIDSMNEAERLELKIKQLKAFYVIGSTFRNKN